MLPDMTLTICWTQLTTIFHQSRARPCGDIQQHTFLSARFNLHRNYAEYLLGKGRLRAKQINQILASIENNKKTAYDEEYAEGLYQKFQNQEIEDKELTERLKEKLSGKKVLILAPGSTIIDEKEKIHKVHSGGKAGDYFG